MNDEHDEHLEIYGDTGIKSGHAKISSWLLFTYVILPIWGVIWLYLYWNGSFGWLDPGSWQQLQRAANTTFPTINQNIIKK